MGQPEDLTKPPLTEADVRRIVQQELDKRRDLKRELRTTGHAIVPLLTLQAVRVYIAEGERIVC